MPAFEPKVFMTQVQPGFNHGVDLDPVSNTSGLATYSGSFLVPKNDQGGTEAQNPGVAALQPTLTVSLQRPSKTSRIVKSRMKLVIPRPVLDGGIATAIKSHESSFDITFMSSEKASKEERQILFGLLLQTLHDSDFQEVIVDNKAIY